MKGDEAASIRATNTQPPATPGKTGGRAEITITTMKEFMRVFFPNMGGARVSMHTLIGRGIVGPREAAR